MSLHDYLAAIFCWSCGQGGHDNFNVLTIGQTRCHVQCRRCLRIFPVDNGMVARGEFPLPPHLARQKDGACNGK